MEGGEERLLLELDRIKKQNAILKKAVLLEQQKSQALEANIKEKEIQLRSATEENDLLNFNIGRLTKRTQQLQEQLNEVLLSVFVVYQNETKRDLTTVITFASTENSIERQW